MGFGTFGIGTALLNTWKLCAISLQCSASNSMLAHVDGLTTLPTFYILIWRNVWGWESWKCQVFQNFLMPLLFCLHTCVFHQSSIYRVMHFEVFLLHHLLSWPYFWKFLPHCLWVTHSIRFLNRSVPLALCCEWNGVNEVARSRSISFAAGMAATAFPCRIGALLCLFSCQCWASWWRRRGNMWAVGCQGASCLDEYIFSMLQWKLTAFDPLRPAGS